jgi:hypothetical protein
VFPLASTSGTRKHAAFTSWDPDPRVRTPTGKKEGGRTGRVGAETSVASRKKEKPIRLLEMRGLYFQGLGPLIWRPIQNGSLNKAFTGIEF